jgi:hypothetical protein
LNCNAPKRKNYTLSNPTQRIKKKTAVIDLLLMKEGENKLTWVNCGGLFYSSYMFEISKYFPCTYIILYTASTCCSCVVVCVFLSESVIKTINSEEMKLTK